MKPGIYTSISNDAYHAGPGLSNSALSTLAKSPAHYHAAYLAPGRPEREPTAAMLAGTLLHCAVLERAELENRYIVRPPGMDLRTNSGKAMAQEIALRGLQVVTQDEMTTALTQRSALLDLPEVAELLSSGMSESSAYWIDEATGILCKCRPDHVHKHRDGSVTLVDVKTTTDPMPDAFSRSIYKFGYHRQAAYYSAGYALAAGVEVAAFILAVVSSTYPFIAVSYILDDETMAQAASEVDELLSLYARCSAANHWPAFGAGHQLIGLPKWARVSQEVEVGYA